MIGLKVDNTIILDALKLPIKIAMTIRLNMRIAYGHTLPSKLNNFARRYAEYLWCLSSDKVF